MSNISQLVILVALACSALLFSSLQPDVKQAGKHYCHTSSTAIQCSQANRRFLLCWSPFSFLFLFLFFRPLASPHFLFFFVFAQLPMAPLWPSTASLRGMIRRGAEGPCMAAVELATSSVRSRQSKTDQNKAVESRENQFAALYLPEC